MATISNSIPIEVAISGAYGAIQDDATKDLRGVITEIDANSKKKEQLRKLQEQLTLAKSAAKAGNGGAALNQLQADLSYYGYDNTTALGKTFSTESGKLKNTNGTWKNSADPSSQVSKDYDAMFEALETQLKSEMDRHSDISSKLQVEMNTKSSILRRADQAVSDHENETQKTRGRIQGNYKG
jgi:hypothetical protein